MSRFSDFRTVFRTVVVAVVIAMLAAITLVPPAVAAPVARQTHSAATERPTRRACDSSTRVGWASCLALVRTDVAGHAGVTATGTVPAGYGPSDLRSAYTLPSTTAGDGQTVAIVDAYDDPDAESNLSTYRAQYGLPACTTANGCFRKVAQDGSTSYPTPDAGWSEEMSLDLDMVSAICPRCHIMLVEANDAEFGSLGAAVNEAVTLGAVYVSNSYGGSEDPAEASWDDQYFRHPGVAVTVSSGDAGYGVEYPAASPYVTSVGGTSLARTSTGRGWLETTWSNGPGAGAGSGCSAYETKPAWQTDGGCAKRTVSDVSAVADPNTGVAVYDTYGDSGWGIFGGTSVASPIIASVYALAGRPHPGTLPAQYPYDAGTAGVSALNDVTSGSTASCSPAYLCTAGPGYDGPTGLGTPAGLNAFVYRAHGDVAGTVTDKATGLPLAGVKVTANTRSVTTDSHGHYDLSLPAGTYRLAAVKYGYQQQTADSAVVAGKTTTANLALTPLPSAAVTGKVVDGSGHDWPLYAKLTASDGTVAFTDPSTGLYSLRLLQGAHYTVKVAAIYQGYTAKSVQVAVATKGITENVALTTTAACTAAGYQPKYKGTTQPFSTPKVPKGWKVTDVDPKLPGYAYRPGWVLTNPGHRANTTGGSGDFAIVDSDHDGQHNIQDTYLTTPVLNLSTDPTPVVRFASDLRSSVNSVATVGVSTDGTHWYTMWRSAGFQTGSGPGQVVVELPRAAHKAHVQVRFGYQGQWSQWWKLDNVFVGNRTCQTVAGGMVVGKVTDAKTAAALNGATITSPANTSEHTTTVATPGDAAIGGGFYWLFSATGSRSFTAAAAGHTPMTTTVQLAPNHLVRVNFALKPTA